MAENNETPFSPLDPLGPEYGGINEPKLDELSYKPFEGDRIKMPEINFSASPVPSFNSLNQPQLNVQNTITGIKPNKPGPQKGQSASDIASALNSYSKAISQANQDKNAYAKIYSYDAGPSGNNFYKRYAAYGQEKFDEIGFTPMRDNESLFNERTTKFDDFSRMMKHSFLPLLGQGFISGPKSLWKMTQGDFTSADLEDAKLYEEAAAIGQSSKGGAFGFINNAAMNFGYTAGIIAEIEAEELAALGVTALTEGGAAPLLAGVTERNIARLGLAVPRIAKYITKADNVFRGTVKALKSSSTARAFYKAANSNVGRVLNPLSNTLETMNTLRKGGKFDNITSLAKTAKTFGGFYADIRNVNAAVSEARLEAGMVENKVYQNLYDEYYKRNNEAPTNEQQYEMIKQSKQASLETLGWNTALIYASNKITFDNILNRKGGISRILGNKTKEILNLGTGKVFLKKTYEAGSKIAKGEFKYFENTIKGSIERMKEMGFKESIKDVAAQTAKKSLTYFKGNISEGLQENAQETIAQAMEKYHTDAFDSKAVKAHLYSKGAAVMGMRDQGSYFAEAWKEQNPFTAKGFETFATGFVMGAFAAPMNALPGWASTGYNKIFKPEKYAEYKEAKTNYGKKVAQTLTDLYNNPKDFLDAKIFNLGNQEIMSKIKQTGGRKEALDASDQTIVSQVYTALRSGTLNDFKEHLSSYKELTPEEFEGTMKGIPKGEGAKYQARIDSVLSRADEIQKTYNEITERYPNPIDLSQYEEGTDAYKKAAIFESAWENAKMNAIFMSEGYKNANKRINEIRNSIMANKPLAKMTDSELQVLLQPERMSSEINLLRAEIDSQKDIISPEELKRKKNKLEALEELSEAFDYYQRYEVIDREKYVEEARASGNIKSIAKEFNISEEEVEEIIRQKIDSELKVKRKTSENTAEAESKLEAAYNKYLKSIAAANGEVYLDENSEKTFEMLLDSYKLGDEAFTLASNINILRNPKDFMDNVERNYAWMQQLYDNRKKYFEGIVEKEITNIELNALLNALADRGYYISAEDLEEYMLNGIPPKEIYNDVTKETYKAGSEKYSEIYQEFFAKMDELRAEGKEKKSSVLDSEYQSQIDELMSEMQSELDALTKTEIKVEKGKILPKGKNKTISIKDVLEQIQPKEYVTLSIINKDGQISFDETYYMNEDSELLYEDEDGEVVDTTKIKTRYTSGERYMYDLQADPVEVERITNTYNEQIEAVKQAYVESKESIELEIPYEEVTQESNLDTPDLLDFRKELYKQYQEEYLSSLSPEEQNALLEDDDLNLETFENWYSQPENKKYFDEYNDKNRPKVSDIETVFTIRGVDVNTKTKTLKELINYRDSINDQITKYNEELERINDVTEKEFKKATQEIVKGLQLDVKNLNKVIAARQFASFPKSIKDSVRSIQKIFKTQDKVERGVTLTEDDKVTGLKKGQKGYRINGEFHRRMTLAMQDVIEDEYSYQGQKDLDTIFNQTIGKKGLNPKSVSDFVSRLRVLSDSDEDALPGTNKLFFDNLEDELKLLPSLTAAQIKLEKQKVDVLEKAEKEKNAAKRDALYDKAVEIQNKIDGTTTTPVSDVVTVYHHTNVKPEDFNFSSFQRGEKQISQFGDGLNAATNTTPFFVERYGNPIQGEIKDSDFVVIDANMSQKEMYDMLVSKGYKFNNPQMGKSTPEGGEYVGGSPETEYDDTLPLKESPGAAMDLFKDFQESNPKVKGVKVINHVIGNENIDPFYVIYDAKSFYGPGTLAKSSKSTVISELTDAEYDDFVNNGVVSADRINAIAEKIKNNKPLTTKETAIFNDKTSEINVKLQELANLEGTSQSTPEDNFDTATKKNTTKDIINAFFAENSYEDSRVAGNFFDLAKDYLESGKKPEFNEKIITREAYDDLIAYLDTIKEKVDSGELYIVGRDLIVYDSNIQHPGGRKDRIAGEIDLILADKDGIYVVDIKSGESKKFLNFNKLSAKKKAFTKRNEYTIQTGGYATMLERMIDRKIAGLAMLPVQRESNKQTNQVTAAGAPLRGSIYNELEYKRDADGNIIINQDIDPKTGKPFNEKQFEQTKTPYKFDFLVPLYRESVQKELDKLFSTREGKLQPGSKRALLIRYQQLRDSLDNITDEATKLNVNKVIGLEKLINKLIKEDKITIPKDIIDQLEEKKKLIKVYTGKEVLKTITKKYKEKLSESDSTQKKQYDKLKNLKSDVSFDDIDKSILEDDSDFINEQLGADKNFEYYYNEHDKYKNEDTKSATVNQQLAVQAMKASRLLTDEDIEDDLIDELSMADASDLIHEGVKRIQFLKTETTDAAANKFKDYQSSIFSLMTATKLNANNLEFVELLDNAIFNAEQGFMSEAYESISEKIEKLESELNRKYTKESRATAIKKEINDLNRFNEALAFAYEMPSDIFESVLGKEEKAEIIEDEYSNEIKVGDIVYSKQNNNDTQYKVKSITSKNIVLEDEKGKEIKVEIGKFDEQYITESEMNAGEITPPGYNPTEGEKSIIEQSQMSVDDFLRNADEEKAKAHQEGTSNTPAQNRKNLLDKTKDCQ